MAQPAGQKLSVFQFYVDDIYVPVNVGTEAPRYSFEFCCDFPKQKTPTAWVQTAPEWQQQPAKFILAHPSHPEKTKFYLKVATSLNQDGSKATKEGKIDVAVIRVSQQYTPLLVQATLGSKKKLSLQLLLVARLLTLEIAAKADATKYVQDLNSGAARLTRPSGEASTRPNPISLASLGITTLLGPPVLTGTPSVGLRRSRGNSISTVATPPPTAEGKRRNSADNRSSLTSSSDIYLSKTFEAMGLSVPQRWVIQPADLVTQKQIGEGVQGQVFVGSWKGAPVAIKRSKPISEFSIASLTSFAMETRFLMDLQPHPNCVSLIGLCPDEATGQVSLVLELCQHGSLEGFIQTRGAMNLVLLVQTLRDVARGLQHLHDSSLIHRDISARNILLSPSGAKIADFGLARGLREEQTVNKTAVAPGPLRWMAPEAFPGFFSPATDVHMFGMLMFEVFTGTQPFGNVPLDAVVGHIVAGHRPTMPPVCPPELSRLAAACWNPDSTKRPSAKEIADALEAWVANATKPPPAPQPDPQSDSREKSAS